MAGLDDTQRLEKIKSLLVEREVYYSKADFSVESSNEYPEDPLLKSSRKDKLEFARY